MSRRPPKLADESCAPCRAGSPLLTTAEIAVLWADVPGWTIAARGGVKRLEKSFAFPDFKGAMAFAVRVGKMADKEDHHPALMVEWGLASVSWWTHKVRGLHKNDFVCAAKTDALFDSPGGEK